jgi:hypothetical protein
MRSIGRKGDVAVQNSLAKLFGQLLHILSCQCHGNETGQKKMLHIKIPDKLRTKRQVNQREHNGVVRADQPARVASINSIS